MFDTPTRPAAELSDRVLVQTSLMFRTAARFLLLRFLPRRILPIVTVVEVALFLRSLRRRPKTRVNVPADSRTAPQRSPVTRGKGA